MFVFLPIIYFTISSRLRGFPTILDTSSKVLEAVPPVCRTPLILGTFILLRVEEVHVDLLVALLQDPLLKTNVRLYVAPVYTVCVTLEAVAGVSGTPPVSPAVVPGRRPLVPVRLPAGTLRLYGILKTLVGLGGGGCGGWKDARFFTV